jgi:thioredoxin 1
MKKIKFFTANWCPSCKVLKPIIDDMMKEIPEDITLEMIDVDENKVYSIGYGVRSLPTLSFTKNEVELEKVIGSLHSKEFLLSLVNKHYS